MKRIHLGHEKFALVDDADYERLNQFKWHVRDNYRRTFYAQRSKRTGDGKIATISMHRLITEAKLGEFVDHIDGDGLNNRRANLRIVTMRENNQNRRIHREGHLLGTTYDKRGGRYYARAYINKERINFGTFDTVEEAKTMHDLCLPVLQKELSSIREL